MRRSRPARRSQRGTRRLRRNPQKWEKEVKDGWHDNWKLHSTAGWSREFQGPSAAIYVPHGPTDEDHAAHGAVFVGVHPDYERPIVAHLWIKTGELDTEGPYRRGVAEYDTVQEAFMGFKSGHWLSRDYPPGIYSLEEFKDEQERLWADPWENEGAADPASWGG